MNDLRWFACNRFSLLPVSRLRSGGLDIALEGDEPARLAVALDGARSIDAYRYAWRHRCPVLMYLWDLPAWHLDGGRPNRIVSWRGRLIKLPRFRQRYPVRNGYYSRIRRVAHRALQVWVPSVESEREIRRLFGIAAELVPFCFDSDRFNRAAGWSPPAGHQTVLSISRLVEYKNHAMVLRAAAKLRPIPRVHIIGNGPEAPRLRSLSNELGVPLQLDESWQSDEEMLAAYMQAHVVMCPSRFEGIGLTPLEAIGLGIPTVASDIPTHREFVAGHATLIDPDDVDGFAAALDAALRAPRPPDRSNKHPIPEMTIEACVERFRPRLDALLAGISTDVNA